MKRNFGSLGLLISTMLLFASCLGDDEEDVTLYSDAALTEFQITTANISYHTTSSTGEDSTYVTTNTSMSVYMFDIDQSKNLIQNTDSMPVGTDASKLLCDYSTQNNGVAVIKNVANDSVRYLLTTDSLDFTQPRTIYVYSSDGTSMRTYTVKVNVHKESADSFHWSRLADNADIAALNNTKVFSLGGRVVLIGSDGTATHAYSTTDGGTWTNTGATLGCEASNSAAMKGDTLFIIDGNSLKRSADGTVFDLVGEANGMRLVGATSTELYAYTSDNEMLVSADGGHTWTKDDIDDDKTLLPTEDIASCSMAFAYTDSTDYALMVGSRAAYDQSSDQKDSLYMGKAVVWRKIVERSLVKEQGKWTLLCPEKSSGYALPRLSSLNVFGYDGNIMAFGGAGKGTCDAQPYSKFYMSADGGITWKADSRFNVPSSFDKTATAVAATVDDNGYIWLICSGTGQVWRGRLNKVGWEKK